MIKPSLTISLSIFLSLSTDDLFMGWLAIAEAKQGWVAPPAMVLYPAAKDTASSASLFICKCRS